MPTHASKMQKPSIWIRPAWVMGPPFAPESWKPATLMQAGMNRENAPARKTYCMYFSGGTGPAMSLAAYELPIMLASMKMAKMNPWGMASSRGASAGVQRNTKVYMDASKSAWMAPSRAMDRSPRMAPHAALNWSPIDRPSEASP